MSRTETYDRRRQDGSVVRITRDMDTGEQKFHVVGQEPSEATGPTVGDEKGAGGAQTSEPAPTLERPSNGAPLTAWVDFAKAVGFEHPEGAKRDEIRDAYNAAHPAE